MKTVGVIGGSGLYNMEGLTDVESVAVETPWGNPSDELVVGKLGDTRMVFLPRHGRGHKIMPTEINFRANIHAMKKMGVEWVISVSAVGSMKEHIVPGQVVIPSQFYDHTKTRASTFFGNGIVAHVSMADPVCNALSDECFIVVGMMKQTLPPNRRERDCDKQFWIIRQSMTLIGIRPSPIEDKFAVRVCFEVTRCAAD